MPCALVLSFTQQNMYLRYLLLHLGFGREGKKERVKKRAGKGKKEAGIEEDSFALMLVPRLVYGFALLFGPV